MWGEAIRRFIQSHKRAYIDLLAVVVGVVGGLGAVVFRDFIQLSHHIFFSGLLSHAKSPYFIVLLPIIGGLIVGPIVYSLAPEARGDSIPQIMETFQREGGQIRKRVGFITICAAAITVGSGGSAGREGPIAQIGASFGSLIGQIFSLSSPETKLLTACGVAAGLSGTFNAPMGGAIFTMEVIYRRFSPYDAVPILLSAVVGKAVASELISPAPEFVNPHFVFTTSDLALCFIMGPLFGLMAAYWVNTYYHFEDFFSWLPIPNWLKPAVGGVVAGISGLYLLDYGIMGVGYEGVNRVFQMVTTSPSSGLLLFLITLGIVKIFATSFTVGSGGSGGALAPTLYIGSIFGVAFGMVVSEAFPDMVAAPPAYGLLGMGAFFAAAARAPLTCIVMIPEMASSYSRLPPLIIACTLSYLVVQALLKGGSLYNTKLMRKGIFLDKPQTALDKVTVAETMNQEVVSVNPQMTISQVREYLFRYNYNGFPVSDKGKLVGMITFDDVRKVPLEEQEQILVGEVAVKNLVTVRPEQSVKYAVDLMYQNEIGRLPVVSPEDAQRLVGIITRADAILAYERVARY